MLPERRIRKMLILPIKRKWYDMIRKGMKVEEYREIKPYYTKRFRNLFTLSHVPEDVFVETLRKMEYGLPFNNIVLRAGYSHLAPAIRIEGSLHVGTGRPGWGAEPDREYFVLRITATEDLLTDDWKERRGTP